MIHCAASASVFHMQTKVTQVTTYTLWNGISKISTRENKKLQTIFILVARINHLEYS
jgi:hypothetical protein